MKILISGGGTGGHLVPGITIYKEFKKNGHDVLYVISERDHAYDVVKELENSIVVALQGISRRLSIGSIKQVISIYQAWKRVFVQIKKFNPDMVIVTGGYLSNIAALSAVILRKPIYMLEQNSVAGITNRFWANFAIKIYTTFPQVKFVPQKKIIYTGNPLLYTNKMTKVNACKEFNLNVEKPVILISGGSQGARVINDLVLELLPKLVDKGFQILWSLGTKEFDRLESQLEGLNLEPYASNVRVYRFITKMDAFWSAGDFALVRSGAGTVSESLYFKVPCLFIPIFNSPDNHQFLNASYSTELGVSLILQEPNLNRDSLMKYLMELNRQAKAMKVKFPQNEEIPAEKIYTDIVRQHLK